MLRATYRLALGPTLGADAARELLAYLEALGISHLRLTPGPSVGAAGVAGLEEAATARGMGVARDGAGAADDLGADVQALFVDPAGRAPLTALWEELAGAGQPFAPWAAEAAFGPAPGQFGLSVDAFHAANAERARGLPRAPASSRPPGVRCSGDVRARLGALAGLGKEWTGAVRRWHADNAALRPAPGAPTAAEELLVYQTLIGAWPIGMDRLEGALVTALRAAGPADAAHEQAVVAFARALLDHGPFRYGFDGWAARVADAGARAALGQTLLRLTAAGAPEIAHGEETWFLALGDPAEDQAVDWAARRAALDALRAGTAPSRDDAKLHLVWRVLALRRELPDAFAGACTPIDAGDGVCAFLRGEDVLVAVAVRETVTGAGGWALPGVAAGRWRDVLSGAEHELPGRASLASVIGPGGLAVLQRVTE